MSKLFHLGKSLRAIYLQCRRHDCHHLAAYIAFYAFFAAIPMLMLIAAVAGYLLGNAEEAYQGLIFAIVNFIPEGADLLLSNLESLINSWPQLGLWSLFLLFFFATLLFSTLESALNKIFASERKRNFLHSRLIAIVLILLISLLFFLPTLFNFLAIALKGMGLSFYENTLMQAALFQTLFAFISFLLICVIVPNRKVWIRYALIGGALFTVSLLMAKHIFAWYLQYAFVQYNIIYGSLTAIMVLMIWVYYLIMIFLIATEVVAYMQRKKLSFKASFQ